MQALVVHRAAVHQRGVGLHRALQHLEQVHVADVRVDDGLEHERDRRTVTCVRRRRRSLLGDELREAVDADELGRAAAQHREHRARRHAVGQRVRELRDRDGLVGEVALHEVVVAHHDALDERVVDGVLLHLHLGRDRSLGGGAVDVVHRVVVEQLDHPVEVGLLADGELQRRDAGAELVLELVEGARERRPLAVELVHEHGAGETELLGHAPHQLGLHLDAFDRRHHEHREVGGAQRGSDVAHEVGVAGRVDHVDLVTVVLERRHRQRHRDAPPRFLGVEVGDGGAVLDPAQAADGAGVVEEGLGQGGLPRAAVTDQGHVADLLRRVRLGRHWHPPVQRTVLCEGVYARHSVRCPGSATGLGPGAPRGGC